MSYIFLAEQGVESSAECFSAMCQSAPSSWTSIAGNPCSSASVTGTSPGSQSGMTSQHLTENHGGGSWTLFVEDSLARTFPRLEKARELMGKDPASGGKWLGLSARWDRVTCSWKTARCLWEEDLPWSSVTLPAWGSMQGGECWELMTLELHTGERECGSWPTPTARPERESLESTERRIAESGHVQICLLAAVQKKEIKVWPTPTVQDSNKATKRFRDDRQNNLTAIVCNPQKWPTPTRSDHKGSGQKVIRNDGKERDRLDYVVEVPTNQNNPKTLHRLNPDWVEWLMGWPIGWTSMKPLETPIGWANSWWAVDPADAGKMERASSGVPDRVARLKAIGNGQVPACAAMAWLVLSGGLE